LSTKDQDVVLEAIDIFRNNPNASVLRNHELRGNLKSQRAIHARFDLCLVYMELSGKYEILSLRVGSHDSVY
jgi:addiction module RelE/StbE family toxin